MLFRKRSTPDDEASDEEIVASLQRTRNADLFAVLYDRYTAKVYQRCLSLTRDKQLAADLTHDIFLKAFVGLPGFDHRSRFGTWLYRIAYNYCLDHLRKEQRHRSGEVDEARTPGDVPEDRYERELLELRSECLSEVIAALEPDDRAVLLMKYQDDSSIKEIGDVLGIGESAVKMRLLRARERALQLFRQLYPEMS